MAKTCKKQIATLSFDILLILLALLGKKFYGKIMEFLPECFYLTFSGKPCGSCGGTRCVYNFFTGNFISAFQLNPFFFFVIIYVILLIILLNLALVFKINIALKVLKALSDYKVIIAFAIGYFVFTMFRLFCY